MAVVDNGRDLQRQLAAAAAEDAFALHAVAVVDAVAHVADVAVEAVDGRQRVADEAAPHPVDAEVRERLRGGQFGRADRPGWRGAAACRERSPRAARAPRAQRAAPRGAARLAEGTRRGLLITVIIVACCRTRAQLLPGRRRFSRVRVRRFAGGEPGSGGVAHRTPVDLRTGRARALQLPWPGPALAALLLRCGSSWTPHAGPAGQVYRAGTLPPDRAGRCGRRTGTPATTSRLQPAVPAARRRCSGCGSWRRCAVLASSVLFARSLARAPPRRAAPGGRACSRSPRSATSGSGASRSRSECAFALAAVLCAAQRPGTARGAAGWRMRRGEPRGGRAARPRGLQSRCSRCSARVRCCRSPSPPALVVRRARAAVPRRRLRALPAAVVPRHGAQWCSRSCAALPRGERARCRRGRRASTCGVRAVPAGAHADGQQHRALRRAAGGAAAAVRAARGARGGSARVARGCAR